MNKKQYFGITYPFRSDGFQHFFINANGDTKDKARSELMHIVFTPKGQRIRNPEFGTDLIKFIFDPNEDITWEAVKNEEDEAEIYVRLDYSVSEGNKTTKDSIVVRV